MRFSVAIREYCRSSGILRFPSRRLTWLQSEDTEIVGMARPGRRPLDDQEDVTPSAWRGSSQEARLTQRVGKENERRRARTGDFGDLRVHHHPCFCICIARLD